MKQLYSGGARTHGMVSLGAAFFAVISLHGFGNTSDPARVAAQILTGIGILGASAILHQGSGDRLRRKYENDCR